jgi:hypothetical protein
MGGFLPIRTTTRSWCSTARIPGPDGSAKLVAIDPLVIESVSVDRSHIHRRHQTRAA